MAESPNDALAFLNSLRLGLSPGHQVSLNQPRALLLQLALLSTGTRQYMWVYT